MNAGIDTRDVIAEAKSLRKNGWSIADIGIRTKMTTAEVLAVLDDKPPKRIRMECGNGLSKPRLREMKARKRPVLKANKDGRQCGKCLRFLAWSAFAVKTESANGRQSRCRECINSIRRERRAALPKNTRNYYKSDFDDSGRVCTRCNEYKEWRFFWRRTDATTGYSAHCIECDKARKRAQLLHKITEMHRSGLAVWQIAEELKVSTAVVRGGIKPHNPVYL